jgi:hypothetical protein
LLTASAPTPVSRGRNGKRAEILLDRQVALLIEDNQVIRAIAVSTGKPSTPTPPGDYRVYAKDPALVVDAVSGVASVDGTVRRRHRLPRVRGRADVSRFAWLCPSGRPRGPLDI